MKKEMKVVHLQNVKYPEKTACGIDKSKLPYFTIWWRAVSCKRCLKVGRPVPPIAV